MISSVPSIFSTCAFNRHSPSKSRILFCSLCFLKRVECCFNHIIGLSIKDGIEKSIFDYEKLLYDSLLIPEFYNHSKHNFKHKHLWVKKAKGLGVTEFMLRLMAWLGGRRGTNGRRRTRSRGRK
jgi:hypothetical protein